MGPACTWDKVIAWCSLPVIIYCLVTQGCHPLLLVSRGPSGTVFVVGFFQLRALGSWKKDRRMAEECAGGRGKVMCV